MRVWRQLTVAVAPTLLTLTILSCTTTEPVEEGAHSRETGNAPGLNRFGLTTPVGEPLPSYLNEDGSLKDGYGIIDERQNSGRVCKVHRIRLRDELQADSHMNYDWTSYFLGGPKHYFDAQQRLFPHAQKHTVTPWSSNWKSSGSWERLLRYCPECRKVQAAWVKEAWRKKEELIR